MKTLRGMPWACTAVLMGTVLGASCGSGPGPNRDPSSASSAPTDETAGLVITTGGAPVVIEGLVSQDPSHAVPLSTDALFGFDSAQLRPEVIVRLDRTLARIVPQLTARLDSLVVVSGYTDASGSADHNRALAEARAAAVAHHLEVALGVDPERIRTVGFGESSPVPGLSPLDPRQRRVEVRVTPNGEQP